MNKHEMPMDEKLFELMYELIDIEEIEKEDLSIYSEATAARLKEQIAEAKEAQKMSYSPYSHFEVGAALLTKSGKIYYGCNIENAAYPLTNCGERTAIFKAISEGVTDFKELVVYGETEKPISPCGACRQVMAEFFKKDLPVTLVAKDQSTVVMTVGELLPYSFTDLN